MDSRWGPSSKWSTRARRALALLGWAALGCAGPATSTPDAGNTAVAPQGTQFLARFRGSLVLPPGETPLRAPGAVTTDFQGHVFVADTGNHRVLQFDEHGNFLAEFGGYGWGDNELSEPTDLSAREGFRLFVADSGNNRVQQFDISDQVESGTIFPFREGEGLEDESLVRPTHLDVDREGRVYIADMLCDCIFVFSPVGEFVQRLGGLGSELSQFRDPRGVAVTGKGRIYVADSGNARVQVFDALGNWISSWGGEGVDLFVEPTGIDLTANGDVVVVDRARAEVHLLTADGAKLFSFGGSGEGSGKFKAPIDVAVARDGTFYIVDEGRSSVDHYELVREASGVR